MNIFSRRKRLLNRTPARANPSTSGFVASRSIWLRRVVRRNRTAAKGMPKMSSRRQFHRALRRHPAWPAVMELAAARARAQKAAQRDRTAAVRRHRTNVIAMGRTTSRIGLRRTVRRNRTLVVALIAVGALTALLTGLAVADGDWANRDLNSSNKPPSARFGAATTYDKTNEEMLVFGGFGSNTATPVPGTPLAVPGVPVGVPATSIPSTTIVANNKTWGFKGGSGKVWYDRTGVHNPPARGYASMAYDGARRNVVLFGGAPYRSTAVSGETWIYNGSDWALANPPGPRPPARQNASMVYDAHRKVVVMFGGRGAETSSIYPMGRPLDDTWTWDGSAWKKLKPPVSPDARHSAAMEYDICRGEAVLFGGSGLADTEANFGDLGNTGSVANETWTWNGVTWTDESKDEDPTVVSPPARIGASMLYSPAIGRVMLYGGFTTTDNNQSHVATDQDIWTWGETAQGTSAAQTLGWEKYNSELTAPPGPLNVFAADMGGPVAPPPRAYTSFAYAPGGGSGGSSGSGGSVQLFGGTPAGDPNDLPRTIHALTGGLAKNLAPQVALPDQWYLGESTELLDQGGGFGAAGGLSGRRCVNPVPLPSDGAPIGGQVVEGPPRKLNTREEIKEIGQLPVLVGPDWPSANRNPKIGNNPNPKYTPPPDCPNRSTSQGQSGENGSNTHLATDSKRNRVYQFFICDPSRPGHQPSSAPKLLIQAYDGTTLKPLGSAIAPVTVAGWSFSSQPRPDLLHDAVDGRFLLRLSDVDLWVIKQDLIEQGVNTVLTASQVPKITLPGTGISAVRFFNHPKTGRAKLLISYFGAPSNFQNPGPAIPPKVAQFDLKDNHEDWSRQLDLCGDIPQGFPLTGLSFEMRVGNNVYGYCPLSAQRVRYAAVRVPVEEVLADSNANDREESTGPVEVFPGPSLVNLAWSDPQTERLLLLETNSFAGTSLWTFDGKVSRYVGRSGLAEAPTSYWASQFDKETGRFYMLVPDHGKDSTSKVVQGGLAVVDTRLTPVPQVVNFGQFSYPSSAQIGILPPGEGLPRRVFVKRDGGQVRRYPDGEKVDLPNEMHYKVLADSLPVPEQPTFEQQDALTVPVTEATGKTEVNFDAEASAYGVRLRAVGGIIAALRLPPQVVGAINLPSATIDPPAEATPICFRPDRELIAGWVSNAHLTDLETYARSSGLEVDSSSKADLEAPSTRCQVPGVNRSLLVPSAQFVFDALWPLVPFTTLDSTAASQLAWSKNFTDVECAGDPNETKSATNQAALTVVDVYGSVTCDQKQASVTGTARGNFGPTPANTVYSVGEGYSKVVIAREAARGVVVTATAEATGIKLPGVSIGYVKTEAVTSSNGRPSNGARATFTKTICRVFPAPNNNPNACLTPAEQQKMADDFNARVGINGKMTLPVPDADYLKGSPGGYIAGVIKPVSAETEEQILARETQKEVPGLVIAFYRDSLADGFGRQVLELAAVRAVTGFGVQCNADSIYSPSSKTCVALTFEDDPVIEELFEDEEELSTSEEAEFDSGGGWTPVEAFDPPEGLALGKRIGRFIETLPIIRRLPIRAMGEALLATSVWWLLGLPLSLASRRFAFNLARRS